MKRQFNRTKNALYEDVVPEITTEKTIPLKLRKKRKKEDYLLKNTYSFKITIFSEFGLEITIKSKKPLRAKTLEFILNQIDEKLNLQKEYPVYLLSNFQDLNSNVEKVKYWESLKNSCNEEIVHYENLIISFR